MKTFTEQQIIKALDAADIEPEARNEIARALGITAPVRSYSFTIDVEFPCFDEPDEYDVQCAVENAIAASMIGADFDVDGNDVDITVR